MTSMYDQTTGGQQPKLPHPSDLEGLSLAGAAQLYAREGLRIVPLGPGTKSPLGGLVPRGYLDASADPGTVLGWWGDVPQANIGVVTGHGSFDVLDVDVHPGGSGLPLLQRLLESGVLPPPSHVVRTPSGGSHLYYQGSERACSALHQAYVDRKARGGYVVAPPSVIYNVDGPVGRYEEVLEERSRSPWQPLPWEDVVNEHHKSKPPRPLQVFPVLNRAASLALRDLVRFVRGLRPGNRNSGVFWALCRALESGLDTGPLVTAALSIGLPQEEVEQTLRSARLTVDGHGPTG